MSLYKREDIWWIDLRHRGRRVRRTTETGDKVVAKRAHDELAARLWRETQTGRQLSDALLAWIDSRKRGTKDLSAVRLIRAALPDRPLIDVKACDVEAALADRSPGTYNRLLVVVRAALNIAKRREWIETVPHLKRRKEPPAPTRCLTAAEWERLRAELPAHVQDMAEFAIATGLRWSNVAMLEWSQVSPKDKRMWIHAAQAKAKIPIGIPLSATALAVLERRGDDGTGFVFTYEGMPIGSARTAWGKAVARAGLDGLRWHDLRHTWASWHAMAGTPLDVLQRLGGWETRAMVDRYSHLAPSYVAQFADNSRPQNWSQGNASH